MCVCVVCVSPQVVSSVCAQLAGVAFAITAVVLYIINLSEMSFWWLCNDYYGRTSSSSAEDKNRCMEAQNIIEVIINNLVIIHTHKLTLIKPLYLIYNL